MAARREQPYLIQMSTIKVGMTGRICSGVDSGQYVKVLHDRIASGGFLILVSGSPTTTDGFDSWVPDWDQLERYFQESGWEVDWLPQ